MEYLRKKNCTGFSRKNCICFGVQLDCILKKSTTIRRSQNVADKNIWFAKKLDFIRLEQ
jgi:hypothetical protein